MKVCIVGGIFDKPPEYRATHQLTPETILAAGLSERAVDVTVSGHDEVFDPAHFDLVHVHHLGNGALRAALDRSDTPFAYTHHRPFVGTPSLRTRLVGVDAVHMSAGAVRAGAATRLTMRCADAVVALSPREAAVHRGLYHVPPAAQAVIPNGIPGGPFTSQLRSVADPPELLYVGQLVSFKQVNVLLDALAKLPSPVTLRLVHQVSDLRPQLEAQALRLGVADRVRFEGPQPPEEIARLLARAAALVLPSAMEALPSVITEAMLTGVPVVATDVGGVRDQVGANGLVVEPGNAGALADALTRLLADQPRWIRASQGIRTDAATRFGVATMIDAHLALYRELLERRPPRRRNDRGVAPWRRLAGSLRR